MAKTDGDLVLAQHIWTEAHGGGGPHVDFMLKMAEQVSRDGHDDREASRFLRDAFFFGQAWAEDGFVTLQAPHKFAAALMCTESRSAAEDVLLPWRAIRLAVPDGLLSSDGVSLSWIYLAKEHDWVEGQAGKAMLIASASRIYDAIDVAKGEVRVPKMIHRTSASLANILLGEDSAFDGPTDRRVLSDRLLKLAARYCVGLLFTLQHTNNFKDTRRPVRAETKHQRGEPAHRVFYCGAPITVDARPQIREWLTSGPRLSSAPALQSLVRGHYKRQVVGQSRAGRKVIWVEPYWRGPEDAPIMVRPYVVGASD